MPLNFGQGADMKLSINNYVAATEPTMCLNQAVSINSGKHQQSTLLSTTGLERHEITD